MILNGKSAGYYGFVVSKIEGVLDMPSRLGEVLYDWGDYFEPLIHESDLFWEERTISLTVFFDGKRFGMSLTESLDKLKALSEEVLLSTAYGNFKVRLRSVQKSKGYTEEYALLRLVCSEHQPQFVAGLGEPLGGGGILIDNYSLQGDFGIVVSEVKFYDNIPELKNSEVTVFNSPKLLSENRSIREIELRCSLPYDNEVKLAEATEKLRKILSMPNYRILSYKNQRYSCFLTEGFQVKFHGKGLVKFNLKMNVASRFLALGFVEKGFIA